MTAETGQELERQENGGELANKRLEAGLAEGNGVINPARWQMLAAIAETVYSTAFVPVGLRDSKPSTLACLLYGDALGLQPMTSLKEIHVIDGVPGLSAAAMSALVRKAHPGHRLKREEIRDDEGRFLGVKISGERGDTEETDEYTFTLEMAARANLMHKANWKNYPEAMCTARASSQICTFLFPDVFMGSPYMPEELEGLERDEPIAGNAATSSPIVPTPKPEPTAEPKADTATDTDEGEKPEVPAPAAENGDAKTDTAPQTSWEVAHADTLECVTNIDADDRAVIAHATQAGSKFVRFPDVEGKWELVGYEVDGATGKEKLLVRPEAQPAGKPADGSPEATVKEAMPKVFEAVIAARERGDRRFIEGVLKAELEGKDRKRLVDSLNDTLREMEVSAVQQAADEANPLDESESAEDVPLEEGEYEHPEEEPVIHNTGDAETVLTASGEAKLAEAGVDAGGEITFTPDLEEAAGQAELIGEVDPEIPFNSATRRAKLVRLAAFCALMEDQYPTVRAWHLSGVIGSASRQFGGTIHALEDLDEEQLEAIWAAAEKHASEGVQFLALMSPADVAKMGSPA